MMIKKAQFSSIHLTLLISTRNVEIITRRKPAGMV